MSYVKRSFAGEKARLLARLGTFSTRRIRSQPWWPEEICARVEKIVWVVYSLWEVGEDMNEFIGYDDRGMVLGVHRVEGY
jgi:hypothetical protein